MSKIYDYAVVGAGCSGLTMSYHLADQAPSDSNIALIDRRADYQMDRIWCYWDVFSHPFLEAVQHTWHSWRVRHKGQVITQTSDQYPYHYIPADRFYDTAFKKISAHGGFDLHLGRGVDALKPENDRINIKVGDTVLSARQVYDGRLIGSDLNSWRCLLQHYGGQIIETNRTVFDPDTITLMDFDIPQKEGIAFVYMLPFSRQRALIEPTVFSYRPLTMDYYRSIIQSYLLERYHVTKYTVEFEEQGIIPMTPQAPPAPADGRIQTIGTQAGMVKGSTGYGFLSIQKSTPLLVQQALRSDRPRLRVPRSNFSIWLDTVFLRYIEQHPEHAPEIFFNLFDRVKPDALVRFLSDVARPADYSAVIRAMPTWPFLKTAAGLQRLLVQKKRDAAAVIPGG
jgi:lycopene beta-cyclase